MDIMTLTQLAQMTDLAPPTVRRYLDDFILFVPSVRVDGTVGFPSEAVQVIRTIHQMTLANKSNAEITTHLETAYPITVISSQALGDGGSLPAAVPAITGLLKDVDGRYSSLREELALIREEMSRTATDQRMQQLQQSVTSATTATFHHFDALGSVPTDLTQIKQAIGVLASRIDRTATITQQDHQTLTTALDSLGAQLAASTSLPTAGLAAIKAEVAEIRHALTNGMMGIGSGGVTEEFRSEMDALKQQIAELRNERGQMASLMSALQDNLVQLHMELADTRQRPTTPQPSHNGHNGSHLKAVPPQGSVDASDEDEQETGTANLRTPRRLGHITGR